MHHCGVLGRGAATKIVNNLIGVTNVMLVAEALLLGTRVVLDTAPLIAVIEASSGRTMFLADATRTQTIYRELGANRDRVASLLRINAKDLAPALILGVEAGLDLPLLRAVSIAAERLDADAVHDTFRAIV